MSYIVMGVFIITLPFSLIGIVKDLKKYSIFYVSDDNKYLIFQMNGKEDIKIPLDSLKSFTLIQDQSMDGTNYSLIANLENNQQLLIYKERVVEFVRIARRITTELDLELVVNNITY